MASKALTPLTNQEIEELYNEFDHDRDGKVSFEDVEATLRKVLEELSPEPLWHHLSHPERSTSRVKRWTRSLKVWDNGTEQKSDIETRDPDESDMHDFLRRLLPGCEDLMTKSEFFKHVQSWHIPSQNQPSTQDEIQQARTYDRKLPLRRRWAAWFSVHGPEVAFMAVVVAIIIACSLWQGLKYALNRRARAAFSAGLVVAKFFAGAIYPTFFFMILSMSRWFATFCRKSYLVSRFINWDLSRTFHIRMSCLALLLSLGHTIAHLSGTFVYGSSSERKQKQRLQKFLRASYVRRSYSDFLVSRPGWTGFVALGCFLIIALLSMPCIRKRHYEIFQLGHLLMYVMFAMLAMHGTAKLVQAPMLGYWLAFPVVCVLVERLRRLYLTFCGHHLARLQALDDGTVVITAERKNGRNWQAQAGQFILLQVPKVSRFQWHPFTVSGCTGNLLQVHIKADGDWTSKLHKMASERKNGRGDSSMFVNVGIDGPFGAPAQRFYTFNKAIIVGSGIGVTPFSACLTDLEESVRAKENPWKNTRIKSFFPQRSYTITSSSSRSDLGAAMSRSDSNSSVTTVAATPITSRTYSGSEPLLTSKPKPKAGTFGTRRCDFHWSVREKSDLNWFAELLNRASDLAEQNDDFTLNIRAHITAKKKKLSTHVFRYLLDGYRTAEHPYSALTGLKVAAEFGRPDYQAILTEYYEDMKQQGWYGRVGVFHCGPPAVGQLLADQCAQITARASAEGTNMRFMFHNEVLG